MTRTGEPSIGEARRGAIMAAATKVFARRSAVARHLARDVRVLRRRSGRHQAARSEVVVVPPRLVAYTLTTLIGQIAHRRLTTDDGITAAEAVDFVARSYEGIAFGPHHQRNHGTITAGQRDRRGELTRAECSGIIDGVSTSLGEASTRIQATDPERRETPRVRTAPPGLRVEPKWLPAYFS
jgi:hypothetical protein